MKSFFIIALTGLLFIPCGPSEAPAFEKSGYKWSDSDLPVIYRMNPAQKPAWLSEDTLISTVQKGFQAWNDVACSDMRFQYGGPTDRGSARDDTRSVFWNETGDGLGNALAVTWEWFQGGRLVDADMEINGAMPWSVSEAGEAGKYDLQSVITHEAGHFLSLRDLYSWDARGITMYGYISPGDTGPRTLTPDDEAGICSLYPANELTVLTVSLPKALKGSPYRQPLQAGGGAPPYAWQIVSGYLPFGLTLVGSSGLIEGSPQAEGTFPFTVRVSDSLGGARDRSYTIEVAAVNLPDIFGIEVGNRQTNRVTSTTEGTYTSISEIVTVDHTTFPVMTYIQENRKDNGKGIALETRDWIERKPGEVRLWGLQDGEGTETYRFSNGLLQAWYPMAVGDHRYSEATFATGGFTFYIGQTVDVVGREEVATPLGALNAYKLQTQLNRWNNMHDRDITETAHQWVVPYLGIIQYASDAEQETIDSFTIGGGAITPATDADGDGLKDYRELVIYGTNWQVADTDGDGCSDGAEAAGGRDPLIPDPQGDLNYDCTVNLADAVLALQAAAAATKPGLPFTLLGDVDGDRKIGLPEAIYILQRIAGLRR